MPNSLRQCESLPMLPDARRCGTVLPSAPAYLVAGDDRPSRVVRRQTPCSKPPIAANATDIIAITTIISIRVTPRRATLPCRFGIKTVVQIVLLMAQPPAALCQHWSRKDISTRSTLPTAVCCLQKAMILRRESVYARASFRSFSVMRLIDAHFELGFRQCRQKFGRGLHFFRCLRGNFFISQPFEMLQNIVGFALRDQKLLTGQFLPRAQAVNTCAVRINPIANKLSAR